MLSKSRKLGSKQYALNQDYRVSPKTVVDVQELKGTEGLKNEQTAQN
jgi:hypothetical protein